MNDANYSGEWDNGIAYDAIVVGSGMAGLAAANNLVHKGLKVLLVEQYAIPGGCTTNFRRGDYEFDIANHFPSGFEPGGLISFELDQIDAGHIHQIQKKSVSVRFQTKFGAQTFSIGSSSEIKSKLIEWYPKEKLGIIEYYRLMETIGPLVHLLKPGVSFQKLKAFIRSVPGILELLKVSGKSAEDILHELFQDPCLREISEGMLEAYSLSPKDADARFFLLISAIVMEGYKTEPLVSIPVGGTGKFAISLLKLFKDRGGHFKNNHLVTKIEYENGRAVGVQGLIRGKVPFSARARSIVYCGDVGRLFNKLSPAEIFSHRYRSRIDSLTPGAPQYFLYLGLNSNLKAAGFKEYIIRGVDDSYPRLFTDTDCSKSRFSAGLSIQSNLYEELAPTGKSTIVFSIPGVRGVFEQSLDSDGTRGSRYYGLKAQAENAMLNIVASLLKLPIEYLKSVVDVAELSTSVTISRYTLNEGGACTGWYPSADSKTNIGEKTSVQNLFLGGHWTGFQSGGISLAFSSGVRASKLALKQL